MKATDKDRILACIARCNVCSAEIIIINTGLPKGEVLRALVQLTKAGRIKKLHTILPGDSFEDIAKKIMVKYKIVNTINYSQQTLFL